MYTITAEGLKRYQELRSKWPRTEKEENELLRLHIEANAHYGIGNYFANKVYNEKRAVFIKESKLI